MADLVRIEFDADIEGMLPAIDILEKIGVIDAKDAEQFRKTNAVYKERQKIIQDVKTAQAGSSIEVDKTTKSYEQLNKSVMNVTNNIANGTLGEVSKEVFEVTSEEIQKSGLALDQFLDKLTNGEEKASASTVSLRTQLRQLKEELTLLEAQGKDNTKEFEEMAIRAAKLEDQIGDTQTRIRNMADDSRGLKTIIEGLSGIAAGFQIVQGTMALVGDENKELEETLVKLNAVMAIANGLTQLNTILQKESFIATAFSNVQRRASVIAINLETAAQSQNIIVKNAAIVTQKALNLVMAAPAPALLLTVIGGIAAALIFFTDSAEAATKQQEKLNAELQLSADLAKESVEETTKSSNEEIKRLEFVKARAQQEGKSLKEIRDIELEIESVRRISAQQNIFLAQLSNASLQAMSEQRTQAQLDLLDLQQKEIRQHDENTVKQIDGKKAQIKALTDLIDLQENAQKQQSDNTRQEIQSRLEFEKKENDERLANAKAVAERILIESKAGTEKQLAARIEVINKERDIELDSVKGKADQIALVNAKADENIAKARSEFVQQRLEEQKQADEILLQQTTKDSKEELDLKIKIIREEARIELSEFGQTEAEKRNIRNEAIVKETEARRAFAQSQFQAEVNIEKADAERRIAIARAGSEEELQARKDSIEAQLALDVAAINTGGELTKQQWAEINRLQAEALRQQEDLQAAHNEKTLNDAKTHADLLIQIEQSKLRGELNDPGLDAASRRDINAEILELDKKLIDDREILEKQRFALGLSSYQEFQNALLQIKKDRIDKENELTALQAEFDKVTQDQVESFIINSGQNVINTYFSSQQDARQSNLEEEIDAIESESETLLKNKRLTEKEKEEIEKQTRERTARAKLAAWVADRDASSEQAAINGLVAITKTFAEYGFTPAAALAVAAVIVETGLQVAAIQAKSPPKFFKGTDYVTLDGNKPGIDTVPAFLTEGEGVDPVDINREYGPALKAIRRRKVAPEIVNKIITEIPSETRIETISKVMEILKSNSVNVLGNKINSSTINLSTNQQQELDSSYYQLPSILDRIPDIVNFSDEDFSEITNITHQGVDIDYEKLSDMIAKKMSDEMAEHIDEVSFRNRQSLQGGIPISNLGQVVAAIKESNQHDPYRS